MRLLNRIFLLCTIFFLPHCMWHSYQPSIQQGNSMPEDKMDQLKVGMTPEQVNFLLGTPILKSPLNSNQWEYVYTYQQTPHAPRRIKQLTLSFKGGHVVRIEKFLP